MRQWGHGWSVAKAVTIGQHHTDSLWVCSANNSDSCSSLGLVWPVHYMSWDKTGQEKQSGAGCRYMRMACVGACTHSSLPVVTHIPFKGCFQSGFFFPLSVQGEKKRNSHPPVPAQSDPRCSSILNCPGDTEFFHKSTPLAIWKGSHLERMEEMEEPAAHTSQQKGY